MDPFKAPYIYTNRVLTDRVNRLPLQYGLVSSLNLFRGKGVPTTTIQIEEKEGQIFLIPEAPRGAAPHLTKVPRRQRRPFSIPHFPAGTAMFPEDAQDRTSEANPEGLMSMGEVRGEKMADLRLRGDVMFEWLRVNALQGKMVDHDGSTIVNFFTEFEKTQVTVNYPFNVDTADIIGRGKLVKNQQSANIGGDVMNGTIALVRSTFFDKLINHPNVRPAFLNYQQGADVLKRNDIPADPSMGGERFQYGSILYIEYEGSVTDANGTVREMIPDDEGIAFPRGTNNLFGEVYGPPTFWKDVNRPGPRFAMEEYWSDTRQNSRTMELQLNPFCYVKRPEVLVRLTMVDE